MEIALKQRLVGAVVLVALAVIFLPLLIKGPAPVSGASEVPLDLPDAPKGEFQTRELPLLTPAGGSAGAAAPQPVAPADAPAAEPAAAPVASGMMPAATAGGDFAVSFGSYATSADAARVVAALHASQLPGYQEPYTAQGRSVHRVRIGPYATRAEAEAARLRAAHVRDDVGSKVVTLDTGASKVAAPAESAGKAITGMPVPTPAADKPAVASTTAEKPAPAKPEPARTEPARTEPAKPAPAAPVVDTADSKPRPAASEPAAPKAPAAGNVGFAVQIGAFGNAEEANRLRDRARAAGLSAFVEQVPTDRGTLSRVRLGPVADRAAAEELRAQAAARIGASGQVRPHP